MPSTALELWDGTQNYYERLRSIDGVEIFEKYITPLHKFVYDQMYIGNTIELHNQIDFQYDLVLLIDVLVHFSKMEGQILLEKILEKNKGALISTPKKPTAQEYALGNIYETHRSTWTKEKLAGFGNSYFIGDYVSLIGSISKKENVQKLKSKLILMNNRKNNEASFLISAWKYYTNKYIKKKALEKPIK